MYQLANKAQDFQFEREVCLSVWLGNLEIDETTDQEITDICQQDPEYPLARDHFKRRTMGKDTSDSYTAVSRKVVQQNRTQQCRKMLCVMGFMAP